MLINTHRHASISSKWTEEERVRIHIHGLNSSGILYGHAFGQLQARPPLTYIVPSNRRVISLAEMNGEIEVTESDGQYITDGFDVEALERPPDDHAILFPSKKHHQLLTAVLKAATNNGLKSEPQPDDSYSFYKGRQKDFGSSIKFNNDPSSLGYGSDQNLLVDSEPFTRKVSMDDVVFMANEEAKRNHSRIKNLVLAVDAQSTVSALLATKHRLSRESTILFTQKGMGIMEEVNQKVFPDLRTRPTYIPAIFSHAVWPSENETIPERNPGATADPDSDVFSHEISQVFSGLSRGFADSLSVSHGIGEILLGPAAIFDGETRQQGEARQRTANYLVSAIIAAKSLNARCVPAKKLLFFRLRDVAINSVLGPMTVRYNCYNGGIVANEERLAHAKGRLREATRVVQAFHPDLTYQHLEKWLGEQLYWTKDRVHKMFQNVVSGRKSSNQVCCIHLSSGVLFVLHDQILI